MSVIAKYKFNQNRKAMLPAQIPDKSGTQCVIMSLGYLDNSEFENGPNEGKYDVDNSFVVIVGAAGETVNETVDGKPVSYTPLKFEYYVRLDEELDGNHYGIKSIDIYDYMQRDYAKIKDEKGYKTFTEYLATMYSGTAPSFDVHGGYVKYGEAIVEAFNNDFEGCMQKPKNANVNYVAKKKLVEATYNHIYVNDSRMNYTGPWDTYTASNQFTTSDSKATINAKDYKYPFFPALFQQ